MKKQRLPNEKLIIQIKYEKIREQGVFDFLTVFFKLRIKEKY